MGLASLVGAASAQSRVGRLLGTGPAIIATRSVYPLAWILVAAAPDATTGVVRLGAALVLQGLAMGIENANDTGYWQIVTPYRLSVGRMPRDAPRAVGPQRSAPSSGWGIALTVLDERLTLIGVAALSAVSVLIVGLSPMRTVRVT